MTVKVCGGLSQGATAMLDADPWPRKGRRSGFFGQDRAGSKPDCLIHKTIPIRLRPTNGREEMPGPDLTGIVGNTCNFRIGTLDRSIEFDIPDQVSELHGFPGVCSPGFLTGERNQQWRGQLARISHRVAGYTMKDCLSSVPYWPCFEGLLVQTVLGVPWLVFSCAIVTPPGEKCGLEFSIELDPHRRARHHLRIGSR